MTNNIKLIKKLKKELGVIGGLLYEQVAADYLILYFKSTYYVTHVTIRLDVIGASIISGDFSIVRDTANVAHFDMED